MVSSFSSGTHMGSVCLSLACNISLSHSLSSPHNFLSLWVKHLMCIYTYVICITASVCLYFIEEFCLSFALGCFLVGGVGAGEQCGDHLHLHCYCYCLVAEAHTHNKKCSLHKHVNIHTLIHYTIINTFRQWHLHELIPSHTTPKA